MTTTAHCLNNIASISHNHPDINATLHHVTPRYIAWIYPNADDRVDHIVTSRHQLFPPDSRTISGLTKQAFWKDESSHEFRLKSIPPDSLENIYRIESRLDEKESGMHRQIHHRVYFTTNTNNAIFVLIYIPSDLFVNTEDLLVVHPANNSPTTAIDVHLLQHAGENYEIIDQEEPEFVSPSHSLLLRITTIPASSQEGEQQISYSIKFHVRYPRPSIHRFRSVAIPPSILLVEDEGSGIGHSYHPILSDGFPQEMWIATGNPQHFYVVIISSILASVVGVILMFRDIARVSTWI